MSERGAAGSGRLSEVKLAAKNLPPAYFAMVMVTGIVSIAALMLGMQFLAVVLFVVNLATYAVLIALAILRLAWFRDALLSDLADHRRAPGFFTAVAGSCLIWSQFILIAGAYGIAIVLWMASTALWIALIYGIFAALWLKHHKPSLADGINGRWLLAVVATQSVAVLGELIAAQWPQPHRIELNFLGLTLWLFGGMLYIWVIALIFYRYTFFEVAPEELTPPYWINTGAMAISTLAGSLLIETAPQAPYLDSILPFLKGFTVFYWATGSWWIPMLVILALWRYVFMRIPLRYDPLNWGAVFALGMYAAATWRMAHAMDLGFLQPVRRQINCEGWRRDLRE
ncbi:MAG: tellurite resistance/C4-dicarboxylate transporter family protein [Xanthobacteraceae bacterium]